MQYLIRFVINNKLAVWIMTIIVIVSGIYAGMNMKEETQPDISTPVLTISTLYTGAAPQEVADDISEPIEEHVESLSGVDTVNSTSSEGSSMIQIEYSFKKDMDEAEEEVEDAVKELDFPEEAQDPEVSQISVDDMPILSLSISENDQSLSELSETIDDKVVPEFEGTDGVSSVDVSGQEVQKVELNLKEDKLDDNELDQTDIKQAIQGSASTFPLGVLQFDKKEKSVLIDGDVDSLKELKNVRIAKMPEQEQPESTEEDQLNEAMPENQDSNEAAPDSDEEDEVPKLDSVKLEDIADIEVVDESDSISKTDGERSIGIDIVKDPEANTVDVANRIKDKADSLEANYEDMNITTMLDQAEPIEQSVDTMVSKALLGALFAVIIILLFLRNIRSTLISVVSIPLSLLIALLVLKQMDITLNIMTLGALTVAIGRVVDDSIVVIENIHRRMALPEEELSGGALINEATRQMFIPILSSTIVTIAVFSPLAFVTGPVGELFMPFALAVTFALAASLLVAITIVPMLSHSMFKKKARTSEQKRSETGPVKKFYKKALNGVLNHKIISFGGAVVLLVASLFLTPFIGASFLPSEGEKYLIATYSTEPEQTSDDTEDVADKAQDYLLDRDGIETIQYSIGGDDSMDPTAGGGSDDAIFFIEYDEDFENFEAEQDEVMEDLKNSTEKGEWTSQSTQDTEESGLTLFVYGDSIDDIEPVIDDLTDEVEQDDTFTNVDSSLSESYDQYTLKADKKKMSEYGLDAAQVSEELNHVGEEDSLTTITKDDEDMDVYFHTDDEEYDDLDDLKDTKINSPIGEEVSLDKVVEVEEGKSPDEITRRGGQNYAEFSADIQTDDASAATQDMQAHIDEVETPDSVDIDFGGVTEEMNEAFMQLGLAMLAAIAIVYLALVITFGGALAPFAILFSLPFTVIGGLLALYLFDETISVSVMIGTLMLIGIVVTNAIVLVDRVIRQEKAGYSTREALLEAGPTRLRPILMTALATIGALLPMAVGAEGTGGILISKGLGITVIGGLTSSTILTLFIVPVVYEFLIKFRRKHPFEKNNG